MILDAGNLASYEAKHIQGALYVDLNNDNGEIIIMIMTIGMIKTISEDRDKRDDCKV